MKHKISTRFASGALAVVLSFSFLAQAAQPDADFTLDLGGKQFDPLATPPAARAGNAGEGLRLVQFNGPIQPEWLDALAREGATALQYIHPYSYVVWADAAAMGRVSAGAGVRWQGEFLSEYKLAPNARGLDAARRPTMVLLSRHGDTDALVDAIHALGASIVSSTPLNRHFDVAQLDLAGDRYAELAQLPGVFAVQKIEPLTAEQMLRGEMSQQSIVGAYGPAPNYTIIPGYLGWLADAGYDGDGVIAGIVDGGFYATHPELAGQTSACVSAGSSATSCGASGSTLSQNHATHVAVAVAGMGLPSAVANGFLRGLGVAPGAKVVRQGYDPFMGSGSGGMIANGMLTIYNESARSGAVLTNNSWGPTSTPQGYDIPTQQVDYIVRDARPDLPGQQPVLDVRSIMNGNGDRNTGICAPSSLGSPDEAKNLFAVGSTTLQSSGGAQQSGIFNVSSNSAHGNACDGRRRPDIVAPGCYTDSASSASGYGMNCGTSMASPVVTGAASLFIEKYRDQHSGATPSPALIKAAFTAVAMDLNGRQNADGGTMGHRPDRFQGYGRIDLDAVVNPTAPVIYIDQTEVFTAGGQRFSLPIAAVDPAQPIRIMLAYTDAPGHGLGGTTPAWVNDLDLVVESSGNSYYGNAIGSDGWSATGGTADNKNNLEGVFLSPAQHGGFVTLNVNAVNIAADALNPHAPGSPAQDFALACYNCALGEGFGLAVEPAGAQVCAPADAAATVSVAAYGAFSGAVTLAAANLPAGLTASFAPATVNPAPGTSTLTLGDTGAVTPGAYSILIEGTSPGQTPRSVGFGLNIAAAAPEAPALVSPTDDATGVAAAAVLEWAAVPGAASYLVEVADTADFSKIVFSAQTQATSITVSPALDTSAIYHWRVTAENACGDDVSAAFSFSTLVAPGDCPVGMQPAAPLFAADFSDGLTGFSTAGGSGSATWGISSSNPGPGSGGNAALAQDLSTTSDQRLTSPAIALPSDLPALTLRFANALNVEPNTSSGGCWDGGVLEISTDGGTNFTQITGAALLTQPYTGNVGSGNPLSGKPAWCGTGVPWQSNVVDLEAYAGQTVNLRWRLGTDGLVGSAPDGWRIDDVEVRGCESAGPEVRIFRNGFE